LQKQKKRWSTKPRTYRSTASFAYVRFLPRYAVPDADPEADAAADGNDAAAEPEPEPEPEPVSIFGGFANKAALASGTDSGQGSEAAQDDGSGAAEGAGQVDGDAEPGTPTQ
jgi:hypothetical protein